jgi:molybdopterin adenylyltransferase
MKLKDIRIAIITVSDKCASGEREDLSGPEIRKIVEAEGADVIGYEIVPDDQYGIEERLVHFSDFIESDVIFTTGGTGFSERDVTPEATQSVIERNAPGFAEAIRAESLTITSHAMLSRAVSGIRRKCIIINLPGSPKAVRESIQVVLRALPHGLSILKGEASECARAD